MNFDAKTINFVAKTIDKELKHLRSMIKRAHEHNGTAFIEIYQNCNIFNDGAFGNLTDRDTKAEQLLYLENGEPMIFGSEKNKGIYLDGTKPKVVETISDKTNKSAITIRYQGLASAATSTLRKNQNQ